VRSGIDEHAIGDLLRRSGDLTTIRIECLCQQRSSPNEQELARKDDWRRIGIDEMREIRSIDIPDVGTVPVLVRAEAQETTTVGKRVRRFEKGSTIPERRTDDRSGFAACGRNAIEG